MTQGHWTASRSVLRPLAWIVLAFIGFALLAACSDGNGDNGDTNGGAAPTTAANNGSDDDGDNGGDAGDLEEVESTILFEDNVFNPDTVTFPAGSRVTFQYDNVGLAVHNMIVQTQEAEGENFQSPVAVNPGESGEFEATFTTPGTYQFICVYHQPGMTGTITIE